MGFDKTKSIVLYLETVARQDQKEGMYMFEKLIQLEK